MDEASLSFDLSRKEYWESFYSKELENFEEFGDEGNIWFGRKNVERIVNWILENNIDKLSPILDVGCGNGITLVALGKNGFKNLTGIDFVKEALQLAESNAKNNNISIRFEVLDFLNEDDRSPLKQEYNIIIDKGTYDAICLTMNDTKNKMQKYIERIKQLLTASGYFILLSCNWTKEELLEQFIGFIIHDEIEIPKITFGGQTGQTVSVIILKKVTNTLSK